MKRRLISLVVCYTLALLFSGVYQAMGREGRMGLVAATWVVMDSLVLWAYWETKIKKSPRMLSKNP